MENSVHYAIDTALGISEWNTTLPSNGGLIYLGKDFRPFSISMFHQIRCLNIIREAVATRNAQRLTTKPTVIVHHCTNYLRQMVLCRANTRLESVRRPVGPHVTNPYVTHTCKDWTVVYNEAERNYDTFINRRIKN
ncbi:hypothetical protein BDQ12DRAFT_697670 [Crucibulum laeve]|uniref:Uncharacterized protein n=1 Tax=Crucibulum laeve TaxID=68775 RepID=A0A5C3M6H0_9AGAR|nr:hypothetical protein BDQ12DRAFT_697670 [Crucibulum laeve]